MAPRNPLIDIQILRRDLAEGNKGDFVPPELLLTIFNFLEKGELKNVVQLVCKHWQAVVWMHLLTHISDNYPLPWSTAHGELNPHYRKPLVITEIQGISYWKFYQMNWVEGVGTAMVCINPSDPSDWQLPNPFPWVDNLAPDVFSNDDVIELSVQIAEIKTAYFHQVEKLKSTSVPHVLDWVALEYIGALLFAKLVAAMFSYKANWRSHQYAKLFDQLLANIKVCDHRTKRLACYNPQHVPEQTTNLILSMFAVSPMVGLINWIAPNTDMVVPALGISLQLFKSIMLPLIQAYIPLEFIYDSTVSRRGMSTNTLFINTVLLTIQLTLAASYLPSGFYWNLVGIVLTTLGIGIEPAKYALHLYTHKQLSSELMTDVVEETVTGITDYADTGDVTDVISASTESHLKQR